MPGSCSGNDSQAVWPGAADSTEHGVEPHVLAHLGPLLLVVHQELAVAVMLAFLAGLGGEDHASHRAAGQLPPAGVPLAEPGGGNRCEYLGARKLVLATPVQQLYLRMRRIAARSIQL